MKTLFLWINLFSSSHTLELFKIVLFTSCAPWPGASGSLCQHRCQMGRPGKIKKIQRLAETSGHLSPTSTPGVNSLGFVLILWGIILKRWCHKIIAFLLIITFSKTAGLSVWEEHTLQEKAKPPAGLWSGSALWQVCMGRRIRFPLGVPCSCSCFSFSTGNHKFQLSSLHCLLSGQAHPHPSHDSGSQALEASVVNGENSAEQLGLRKACCEIHPKIQSVGVESVDEWIGLSEVKLSSQSSKHNQEESNLEGL